MATRTALLGIIVEDVASAERINAILHDYRQSIIGRMGLPHNEKQISVISVVMEAPADVISAVAGKIGMVPGVSAKAIYAPVKAEN